MIVLVNIPAAKMYKADEKCIMSTGATINSETSHLGRTPYQIFFLYDIIPVSLNLRMLLTTQKTVFYLTSQSSSMIYLILTSSLNGDLFMTPGPTGCFGR